MLEFDEASHSYTWNGKPVPGVTSVIKPLTAGLLARIPQEKLEIARQQGVAIHKMVELHCLNNLETVPDWMQGYLIAWERFVAETGFEFVESESKVCNPGKFAGQLDLAGFMTKGKKKGLSIIDIKRSFLAGPAIGVQLAAYQEGFNYGRPASAKARFRFALQLREDGTYRFPEFTDPTDISVFYAHLTIHNHKEKYHEHYSK